MKEHIPIENTIPDTRRDDPIAMHPGSPRWIFFDDTPPSKEERKARKELIVALEKECAKRDPDWVDPEIDRYHARIEVRRLAIWLTNWYRRMAPDTRNRLLFKLSSLELRADSYASDIKERLLEFLPFTTAMQIVSRLRLSPLIRNALIRPQVDKKPVVKRINRTRIEPKLSYVGPFCKTRKFEEVEHKFTSKQTELVADSNQAAQLNTWSLIHKTMDFPTLQLDLDIQEVTRTLFCNPDGSRILNRTERERSPIQARESFARRHKLDSKRVTYSRVHYTKMDESLLRQLNLEPSSSGYHLWVVSGRKLSDEVLSSYYDTNPYEIERVEVTVDEFGIAKRTWTSEYKWNGSVLLSRDLAIKKNDPFYHNPTYVPKGMKRLTIREFERALLAGATFRDGFVDIAASSVDEENPIQDTRDRPMFDTPTRAREAMSDQEQTLYFWLKEMELIDLAEMLRIDFTDLPQGCEYERTGAVITLLKELSLTGREYVDKKGKSHLIPTETHQELIDLIYLNTSSEKEFDTIRNTLWDLLESLEEVISLELRTTNSFTIFQKKDD